jgi:tetratricopeptide (TPR) repeat protein
MIGCWRRLRRYRETHCNQYHDKNRRNQGKSAGIPGIHPNKVVTTLLGLSGGQARAKPGKIGVFACKGCRQGPFHPKHGIAHDPQDPAAYYNLGTLLLRTRRYDEAACAYRQSLRYRTNHPATYLNLGAALKDGGRISEAVAAWEQTLRLALGDPSVHAEMARIGRMPSCEGR